MSQRRSFYLEIFAVSFAGLVLEISYTRVISFKLYYYYTYLVIGLSLLGIGTGAVLVAVSQRLRRAPADTVVAWASLVGAASVAVGYVVVAVVPIDTLAIWDYGTWASVTNVARLFLVCLVLFATFVSIGLTVSTILGRHPDRVGRLYFADLVGAGLACAVAIVLIGSIGPPAAIFLAGVVLALVGARLVARWSVPAIGFTAVTLLVLVIGVIAPDRLPDQVTEASKTIRPDTETLASDWGPVFRVDVTESLPGIRFLHHDGLFGSAIYEYDGDPASLSRFDTDPRSFPFLLQPDPPESVLIIGAAGGNEVLASLHFGVDRIDAVELNPVTHELVTDTMADYAGHVADDPRVDYVQDDGRTFLARTDDRYDLIWFVAPDSYAATNAATSGAFVLSESYLYTQEMIAESLDHLTDDGIVVAQFGEYVFDEKPNRTTRYVGTARKALEDQGVADPGEAVLVATSPLDFVPLSTIMVKGGAFTDSEIERFLQNLDAVEASEPQYVPGSEEGSRPLLDALRLSGDDLDAFYDDYPYDVRPITDDRPFFWHFVDFGSVTRNLFEPLDVRDLEDSLGERVLLLLLGVSILYAAVFLLLPFVAIRRSWRRLPAKGWSAIYFAALGLGFMAYEISMIQRLTQFLGYPTRSLTVTLFAILVFSGLGALLTTRYESHRQGAVWLLLGALVALTIFYQYALSPLTDALLDRSLSVRVGVVAVVLAPLGLCLGAFMPLGLGRVAQLTDERDEYVAWAWAVNGFFSVIGSVLTTIVAMTFGFRTTLYLALVVYVVAVIVLGPLGRARPAVSA